MSRYASVAGFFALGAFMLWFVGIVISGDTFWTGAFALMLGAGILLLLLPRLS